MCTHTRTRTLCRQTTGNVNKITVSVHCTYINRKSRKYLQTHTHTLILRWTAFYTKCIALQTQNKNFITYCVATIIIIEADCWFLSRVTKLLFFFFNCKKGTQSKHLPINCDLKCIKIIIIIALHTYLSFGLAQVIII